MPSLGLLDLRAVFGFSEEAGAVARDDAAGRERRAEVKARAAAVEAVKLEKVDRGVGRMVEADTLFRQLG